LPITRDTLDLYDVVGIVEPGAVAAFACADAIGRGGQHEAGLVVLRPVLADLDHGEAVAPQCPVLGRGDELHHLASRPGVTFTARMSPGLVVSFVRAIGRLGRDSVSFPRQSGRILAAHLPLGQASHLPHGCLRCSVTRGAGIVVLYAVMLAALAAVSGFMFGQWRSRQTKKGPLSEVVKRGPVYQGRSAGAESSSGDAPGLEGAIARLNGTAERQCIRVDVVPCGRCDGIWAQILSEASRKFPGTSLSLRAPSRVGGFSLCRHSNRVSVRDREFRREKVLRG
jgi:hypothetical protein